MNKFLLQFHAAPGETSEWLAASLRTEDAWASAVISSPPFLVPLGEYYARHEGLPAQVIITPQAPSYPKNFNRVVETNPDALVLDIGALGEFGLDESSLGSVAVDKALLRRWKRIERDFKKRMICGAKAFNPKTGLTGEIRSHWFSPGAVAMANSNVPLWSPGRLVMMRPTPHDTHTGTRKDMQK